MKEDKSLEKEMVITQLTREQFEYYCKNIRMDKMNQKFKDNLNFHHTNEEFLLKD